MVKLSNKRPLGLHILSFHNLLNAAFWIKKMSEETFEFESFLDEEFLCF